MVERLAVSLGVRQRIPYVVDDLLRRAMSYNYRRQATKKEEVWNSGWEERWPWSPGAAKASAGQSPQSL
jgi:hypothetical protein